MCRRPATTLVELLLLLAVIGTMVALALPPIATALDGAAVRAASQDVEALFASAREQALARQAIVWVVFDGAAASARLRIPGGGTRT
ncbi:MAG: hypothetical protein ACRENQ_02490, partial [Gemmatimonadaceae bacterium]